MERRNVSIRAQSDRLSSLPDSLISHILSFLPTKLSVATSILARRYRSLWADVVNLDFDSSMHNEDCFADTVNCVMLLRNVWEINIFRLTLRDEMFTEAQFDIWIRSTIARHVQTLQIDLYREHWLPRCLFTCKTLVDLSLHLCGSIPDVVLLPNLKKLRLESFHCGSDEKFLSLISGCPVLEELTIKAIVVHDLETCIISSPTMKRFTLDLEFFDEHGDGDDSEDDFEDNSLQLQIKTPALRYLDVKDHICQRISTETFNSLVEANICLDHYEVRDDVIYPSSVLELVGNVCQVKFLLLSVRYRQFLDCSFAAVTWKFSNLTKLELNADWRFLIKFLESADNLQVLVIKEGLYCEKRWTKPQQVPVCLSSHLKQVAVHPFGYTKDEFQMVRYILKHGKVLNTMDIIGTKKRNRYGRYVECDFETKFNALQKISSFERQSVTCKLHFS